MVRLILLAGGGALGTLMRYGFALAQARLLGPGLPLATLSVNVVGCFLLGAVGVLAAKGVLSDDARLVLATGLCGGFTTYSTFNAETLAMLDKGAWLGAVSYVAATLLLCALAGIAGLAAARAMSA